MYWYLGNPHVKDICGMWLIISIELDVDATPLLYACLDAGLIFDIVGKGKNIVKFNPLLVITEQQLEFAADVLSQNLHILD